MIDKKWIGHQLPPSEMVLDRSRLRFFAKAIGETAPVYTDVQAAQAAGYADLPAPPTFLFGAELDSGTTLEEAKDILRRHKIEDDRWQRAMQAIGDSLQILDSKAYVRVYERDAHGNVAEQNRLIGPVRGADTRPTALGGG